ncbi:hypothetical protein F66182_4847 [Fusarium sp. NRRL 66182]|nr:hypothetical protein F66182_4847 [Fusarium sp. NRRL 66182]
MEDHISLDKQMDAAPAPKRRKLRKGTASCWECKRRKAKCTFSADALDICDSCRRRGTDCVGQETADKPPAPGSNKNVVDRLGQVEALLDQLLKGRHEDRVISPGDSEQRSRGHQTRPKSPAASTALNHHSTTVSRLEPTTVSDELWPAVTDTSESRRFHALSQSLLAAWPDPADMNIILNMPVEFLQIIRATTCAPPDEPDLSTAPPSTESMLQLPPRGSHPVLFARKMLILAAFLQSLPSSSTHHLDKLSISCEEIMSRLVKTAHDLVTCNDELVSSLEGIQCIMLEGVYENYAGNLRRSWFAARRAVMVAQMLGVNREITPLSLRGAVFEPEELWFRIIMYDRYLCLMLGLPQSSPDESFARHSGLDAHAANRRMQRLCSVACGRLLSRSSATLFDRKLTNEIDKLLRDASSSMPAQWWIIPNLSACANLQDRIRETLRFHDQLMQYHLLLQLHFPYFLHPDKSQDCTYNKMIAITASREVLNRFISIRSLWATRYYCRGTDLIAFMSCAALSIGHVICDERHEQSEDRGFHFYTQQRLSDRGLLEQVLSIAQESVDKNNDGISMRLVRLLHHLLAIEDDVGEGVRYRVSFESDLVKDRDLGHSAKPSEDGTILHIHIPHLPAIRLERQPLQEKELARPLLDPRSVQIDGRDTNGTSVGEIFQDVAQVQDLSFGADSGIETTRDMNLAAELWAMEGFDMNFVDNFIEGSAEGFSVASCEG